MGTRRLEGTTQWSVQHTSEPLPQGGEGEGEGEGGTLPTRRKYDTGAWAELCIQASCEPHWACRVRAIVQLPPSLGSTVQVPIHAAVVAVPSAVASTAHPLSPQR